MRAGLVAIVVGAGCGAPSRTPAPMTNENVAPPRAWKKVASFPRVSAPRPEIDVEHLVPDFHEELRWPLSAMSHPELDPQFEIAAVFAQPGVGWLELCERGIQNRVTAGRNRDELDYLRGWCSAIKGDADAACGKLAPLTSSPVLGMPAAVRIDVANIIANAGDVDQADKLLAKHRISDIAILDTLAATYVELGMERDAYEINRRALDTVGHTTSAMHCRRIVKDIVLGGRSNWTKRAQELEDHATKRKVPDETCVALHAAAQCWMGPASKCHEYFRTEQINTRYTFLLAAYRAWPNPGNYRDWGRVVREASLAADISGARNLAQIALDTAVRVAPTCAPDLLGAMDAFNKSWPTARLRNEMARCHWVH